MAVLTQKLAAREQELETAREQLEARMIDIAKLNEGIYLLALFPLVCDLIA